MDIEQDEYDKMEEVEHQELVADHEMAVEDEELRDGSGEVVFSTQVKWNVRNTHRAGVIIDDAESIKMIASGDEAFCNRKLQEYLEAHSTDERRLGGVIHEVPARHSGVPKGWNGY